MGGKDRDNPSNAELREQFELLDREPFRNMLARVMGCAPTDHALKKFANKYPARWSAMLSHLAKLTGYSEEIKIDKTVTHRIGNMSDSEVDAELEDLRAEILKLEGEKDITPESIVIDQS